MVWQRRRIRGSRRCIAFKPKFITSSNLGQSLYPGQEIKPLSSSTLHIYKLQTKRYVQEVWWTNIIDENHPGFWGEIPPELAQHLSIGILNLSTPQKEFSTFPKKSSPSPEIDEESSTSPRMVLHPLWGTIHLPRDGSAHSLKYHPPSLGWFSTLSLWILHLP